MISAINISSLTDTNYINQYNKKIQNLSHLNKLNIFIGENNSGKSRMMRYLLKSSDTKIMLNYILEKRTNEYNENLNKIRYAVSEFNFQGENSLKIDIEDSVYELEPTLFYCNIRDYIDYLNPDDYKFNNTQERHYSNIKYYLENIFCILTRTKNENDTTSLNTLDVTYIPILRGIENFNNYYKLKNESKLKSISMDEDQRESLNEYKDISKHIYEKKISSAYQIPERFIFTAENLYDEIKSKLLGEEEGRQFISDFEKFISKEFYNDEGFTIIPQEKKGYLNVKIGDSTERPLHDLGDGIKQIITIMYKIYEKRNKEALFFIEEPELNLHPGYQRKIIEILQNDDLFAKHQYFITTHSNHIVDNCFNYNNISIYKFINVDKNNDTFKILNTTNNDVEVLELLGVYNSSVFISNCTIWVEGISDKVLLSKYLTVYMKEKGEREFKEDIHYAFVEYGGNNITHWSFIEDNDIGTINASGITNKSFIILDNDNDSSKKATRKKKLQSIFGENYCELTVREIENTIKREVLEKTLFDGKKPAIKENYKKNEYANKKTYMGKFIDDHYDLKRKYGNTKTGTINHKLEFSKKVAQNINDINDLSTQAKNLCDKLYNFIKNSNK